MTWRVACASKLPLEHARYDCTSRSEPTAFATASHIPERRLKPQPRRLAHASQPRVATHFVSSSVQKPFCQKAHWPDDGPPAPPSRHDGSSLPPPAHQPQFRLVAHRTHDVWLLHGFAAGRSHVLPRQWVGAHVPHRG